MIPVQRPAASAAVSAALGRRHARSGLTELEAAKWHYADIVPALDPLPPKPPGAPEFAAYGDGAVKAALHDLFKGHCAYCESRYDHVSPMDVEHYRPKGAVIEADGGLTRPGYYWLAAEWQNLLPSCIGCNRARAQEQRLADGTIVDATSGKANLFPLIAGTARATAPGDEAAEQALLLDPCGPRDPRLHLLFRADGYVEPRSAALEQAEARGLATIEVCGLDRASLVESRRRAATRLRDSMAAILSADYDCRTFPQHGPYHQRRARVEAEFELLAGDLDYRAMTLELRTLFVTARQCIQAYFASEAAWRTAPADATRAAFVEAVREIVGLHREAGLHQPFIVELYGLAGIPLDQL